MKYSISIIAMNGLDVTRRCVESVLEQSSDYELILTDNGSNDGTLQFFQSIKSVPARVVCNLVNLGFKEPHKKALQMSSGEYFVMLNNDTVVTEGWLETLESPFKMHSHAALSAPAGGCCALDHEFHGVPGKMEYVEGACLMAKAEIVKKHGLFSDYLYFAYGEDSDLSLRMRVLGYSIHQVQCKFSHIRGMTSSKLPFIKAVQDANHHTLRHKWSHYLKVRRMDYPIVVKRMAAIGDVVLTTPIVRQLKIENPRSPIHVWTMFPEIFRGNPNVASAFKEMPRFEIHPRIINLDMAYENLVMCPILEAYERASGVATDGKTEIFVNGFSSKYEHSICIHAGPTTWRGKNWEPENWKSVVRWIQSETSFKVVAVGSTPVPFSVDTDLCGKLSIHDTCALLKDSKLLITLDSAPLHFAQAVACPVLGLFGATLPKMIVTRGSPAYWVQANPSIKCAGERHLHPGRTSFECDGTCMDSVTPEMIINKLKEIL